jgi:hypothetical protein
VVRPKILHLFTNLHVPDSPPQARKPLQLPPLLSDTGHELRLQGEVPKALRAAARGGRLRPLVRSFLAAGGAAGATALTVSYPLEFTYTRLAADTGVAGHGGAHAHAAGGAPVVTRQYAGIADCIRQMVKANGIRGIYRGYGPSVAGIIVYRAGASLLSRPRKEPYLRCYLLGDSLMLRTEPIAPASSSTAQA